MGVHAESRVFAGVIVPFERRVSTDGVAGEEMEEEERYCGSSDWMYCTVLSLRLDHRLLSDWLDHGGARRTKIGRLFQFQLGLCLAFFFFLFFSFLFTRAGARAVVLSCDFSRWAGYGSFSLALF